jgi:TRAP-type C4-dicarboxylate transport system substrate-binding protein
VLNDYKIAKKRLEQKWKEKRERDITQIEKETMTVTTVADDEQRKKAAKVDEMDDDELDALGTKIGSMCDQ